MKKNGFEFHDESLYYFFEIFVMQCEGERAKIKIENFDISF